MDYSLRAINPSQFEDVMDIIDIIGLIDIINVQCADTAEHDNNMP